jgi:glycine/D-amino acid oxidase-like deaminating enzyme
MAVSALAEKLGRAAHDTRFAGRRPCYGCAIVSATYPRYREPCGWQQLLAARTAEPALCGDVNAEVAIVGAGYTGLAAARAWAEARPDDRVAVLDAGTVGDGSPGRNSGFMLEIALADDADPHAVDRMERCNALIGTAMTELRSLVNDHGIRCQLERTGTYRGAATAAGRRALGHYRAFLEAAGLPFEEFDRDALETRLGTRYYGYGLYSPDCSLVQPAALIRGLADHRPDSVCLYENSPALDLQRDGGRWRLRTPDGALTAPTVILANNAFARELAGGLRPRLVVMYTYAALTAPLPEATLATLGGDGAWGILPAHRLGSTLRRTRDGRFMVRSFYGYEHEGDNAAVAARLAGSLARRFPGLPLDPAAPFEHVWGGATGVTYNGAPVWGRVADGLFVSAGCNGGGVVKGTLFGRLLAEHALGRPGEDPRPLFGVASWMPPEPIRRVGFAAVSAWERRTAGAEC